MWKIVRKGETKHLISLNAQTWWGVIKRIMEEIPKIIKGLHKVSRRYGCAACQPLHPLILSCSVHIMRNNFKDVKS